MTATVRDVMTRKVLAAREGADFQHIAAVLRRGRVSALPVLDAQDRVIGVVSEADLLARLATEPEPRAADDGRRRRHVPKAAGLMAAELMTRPAVVIDPDATVREAARQMYERRIRRLPVVNADGRLVGIISRADVLSIFARSDDEVRAEIVQRLLTGEFGIDPHLVGVTVRSGVVTISGQASTNDVCLLLVDAIRHVDGVTAVRDRLTVRRDVVRPASPPERQDTAEEGRSR